MSYYDVPATNAGKNREIYFRLFVE